MRHVLSEAEIHPAVREKIAKNHRDFVDEVIAAVAAHDVVVVGMGINPNPRRAKKLLRTRSIAFHEVSHGSYFSGWYRRNALKMWTGWPTFPMVFVKGVLVGGANDLARLDESGELARMLAAPRTVATSTPRASVAAAA
jgi:monothiol glutaredoxin